MSNRRRLAAGAVCVLAALLPVAASASTPVSQGYRDFSYGTTVTPSPTGEKPQSKLWYHDGSWWGCLWDNASNRYRIYRFDKPTQSFVNVGPDVDNRAKALVDALWDGQRLYIATHLFDSSGTFLLFSYTYNAGTWVPRSGFPATMGSGTAEALTIAKDTTGKLWIAWQQGNKINVIHSTTADNVWGSAFVPPGQGNSTSSDDICAITSFDGKIGIVWSNQNDEKMYFVAHVDGAADNTWLPRESALSDPSLPIADDHINLKILSDGGDDVYAVTKTSVHNNGEPLVELLKRDANGSWTHYIFGRHEDNHTRPILLIDSENRKVYVFATGSNGIRMKSSSLDNISFPAGSGSLFISSSSDGDINNATSTKQNVNGTTDLLVLASDATTHFYLHNTLDLPTSGPVADIAVTPAPYAYGNVAVSENASQIFQVRNAGTATLNVTTTTLVGTNAGEFSVTGGGGAFSLAAGATHDVTVRFAPTSAGGKSAALRIASNDPDENPFDVALSGTGVIAGPDIAVSPASRDYGSVVVGASGSQTFQVRNDGTTDLHVSSTSLVGTDPGQFAIQSGGGSFTLAPAGTRDVVVNFVPTTSGAKSAALRFASDDADENPLDAALTGTGILPDIAVTPALQGYGDVILNTRIFHTFEVRNSGTGSLSVSSTTLVGTDASQFRIDSGGGAFTLGPGAQRIVTVSLQPTSLGAKSASLRFASNDSDENPFDAALSGNGASLPSGGVAFAEGATGSSSSSSSVTTSTNLSGQGGIYMAAISSHDFLGVSNVSGLGLVWTRAGTQCAGNGSTGVEVWVGRGAPTAGTVTATLSGTPRSAVIVVGRYTGADANNPISAVVRGNSLGVDGSCSGGSSGTSYSFPLLTTTYGAKVFAGIATSAKTHTPGSGYTARGGIQIGRKNSTVGVTAMDRPLLAAGGVYVEGTFSSSADYAVVGVELRPGSPVADIAVSPASADYGSVVVGANGSRTFQVRNDGSADLHVTSTTLVGTNASQFSIQSGGGAFTLTGGGTHDIVVLFAPASLGAKSAALRIASDDPDEATFDDGLAGTGVASATPDIAVSPTSRNYGDVNVGASASQTFQVRNDGTASLDVTSTSLTGTDAAAFAIQSGGGAFTLAPSATHDVVVTFNPTATGPRSATLRIASTDPDENPFDVALSGNGTTAPPTGTVAFAGSTSGGSVSAITVSTAAAVPAASGQLVLAAIASKNHKEVVGVSGMGLTWIRVLAQCGGRDQTGVEVWRGSGTPTAGVVTATLAAVPNAAAIIVARYSGADPTTPIGNMVSANTLGLGGLCSGGVDGMTLSMPLTTGLNGAVVFGALAMRNHTMVPGPEWAQRDFIGASTSGSMASVAILDGSLATAGTVTLTGTFDSTVDWAAIGLEIRPAALTKTAPQPAPTGVTAISLDVRSGFGARTPRIELASPTAAPAEVDIYDARGRLVRTLWNGPIAAGRLLLEWRAEGGETPPAGVYFVRAAIADRVLKRKLLVLR